MNRADLIAMIRMSGRRNPPRGRVRRMAQPDGIRLAYFSALRLGLLRDLRELLKYRLIPKLRGWVAEVATAKAAGAPPVRADAGDEGDVHEALEELADALAKKWTSKRFAQVVQPFAQQTVNLSREQLAGVLKDAIGIDVLAAEPHLAPEVAAWTARNVALVKTLPQQFFADLEARLIDGLHSGERWENLAELIETRMGVTESRANLIARDQVGKLYGQINRRRQEDLGFKGYTWRTVRDNRVRELHEERDGEPFDWDDPPDETTDDGHPGTPINCRCYAEPPVADLFKEAWEKPAKDEEHEAPPRAAEPTADPVWEPAEPEPAPVPKPSPALKPQPQPATPLPSPLEKFKAELAAKLQAELEASQAKAKAELAAKEQAAAEAKAKAEAFEKLKAELAAAQAENAALKAQAAELEGKPKAPKPVKEFPDYYLPSYDKTPEWLEANTRLHDATTAQIPAAKNKLPGIDPVRELYQYTENSTRMNAFAAGSYDPKRDPAAKYGDEARVKAELQARIDRLDKTMSAFSVKEDVTVYRAMEIASLGKEHAGKSLGSIDHSPTAAAAKRDLLETFKGLVYTDPVFASTSLSNHVAEGFMKPSRVLLRIAVPKGTPGAYFNGDRTLTSYTNEAELLLARGLKFEVVGVHQVQDRDGNTHSMLDVRVKKPRKARKAKGEEP